MTGSGTLRRGRPVSLAGAIEFLDHVERGHTEDALDLVAATVGADAGVTGVVRGQLAAVQRIVGDRWHLGTFTVAQEHRVSAVVEDALGLLRHHVPRIPDAPRVALVCAIGEWHVTPARMAALVLRDAGWHVDLLGASTPAEQLHEALVQTTPEILAISATLPLSLRGVPPLVEVARTLQVPVIGGGAAFGTTDHRARMLGLDGHASDPAVAARTMSEWLDRPPDTTTARPDPGAVAERRWLTSHRSDLVARAEGRLASRLPWMAGLDQRQQDHTRRDLDYTLQFLETALLVGDPSLFTDYVAWLDPLLTSRGLPPHVLPTSLAVLGDVVGGDRTRSRGMLHAARAAVEPAS